MEMAAVEDQKSLFIQNKYKSWMFLKIKNASKNILTNMFVSGICNKNFIFNVVLMIM
jgi:hypothetical protein